jgi:eukaryotic-like serine/threonine-protein kinase
MADPISEREPIEELAESFLARFRAGERPPLTELVAAHPELAEEIRALFPALIEMEQAGSAIGPVAGWAASRAPLGGTPLESLGDYRIIREIGRGGMGVVYEAAQESLGRHVALKVFAPWAPTDCKMIERFQREAKAAARLHHTNIVPVFGVGEHDSYRYYVMQFIQGQGLDAILGELRRLRSAPDSSPGSLTGQEATDPASLATTVARSLLTGHFSHLAREPRAGESEIDYELFDPSRPRAPAASEASSDASQWASQPGGSYARTIARVGLQVADALAHAHGQGILHRDIKPSNLLLDIAGNIWVTDFGLAKADDAGDLTESGDVVGTARYMAPERFRGESGPESDVYSLGVTLYELLTLRPAFDDRDRARLIDRILHTGPPPLRAVDPRIPRDLETIVLKAMARHPADRYASARALAEDLERFLQDRTILARRSSASERLWRWCKRNPLVAGLTAAVFLVMAIGTTVSAWQAARAERAASAEKAARSAADEREAETRAVLRFVENQIIAAARPEGQQGGLGRDVTLRQAIQGSLPHIAGAFSDQPLIEARLRLTLGTSFYYLGEPEIAKQQYEASRAIYAKLGGPDHPGTLRSMTNLAATQGDLGRHAEALKLREEILASRKARLGPRHPDTLLSMHALGLGYYAMGRHAEALRLFEETLALRKAKLGPHHPDTLRSMANLAASQEVLGRHADAKKLREETLALRKTKLGPHHPETLTSMCDLGLSYLAMDRVAEALKLFEETLALQKAELGFDHPETLLTMAQLAVSQAAQGRHAEAKKLREETLALRKAKLGKHHPDTLTSMHDLGLSYRAVGRPAEALKLFEETLALQKAELGFDHRDTLWTMDNLAVSQTALGHHAEAKKLREETLALRKAKLGPHHPDTLWSMHELGVSYNAIDRHSEALKLFQETLDLRKAVRGPDHPETLWTMANLAVSQAALGRHAEAKKLREETLALRKAKLGPRHSDTLLSMEDLGISYAALDRHAEALKLFEENLALRTAELGFDHPDTLRTMARVAVSQAALGRHAEALELREQILSRRRAKLGLDHVDTLESQITVAGSLLRVGRCAEAAELARQAVALWEKRNLTDPPRLFDAAHHRAIAAAAVRAADPSAEGVKQASAEADQAVAWLHKAVAAGWSNVTRLEADPDLDAIRDRADFKSLLGKLKSRKNDDTAR